MARLLIIGGGCRGRLLAREFVAEGHAVRITTRSEANRPAIEAVGAECWIGTPERIGSLRNALAGVVVLCWLLATAEGAPELQGSRLQMMLTQVIDTTVRGVVYEVAGGEQLVAAAATASSIPYALLRADPRETAAWLRAARRAVSEVIFT